MAAATTVDDDDGAAAEALGNGAVIFVALPLPDALGVVGGDVRFWPNDVGVTGSSMFGIDGLSGINCFVGGEAADFFFLLDDFDVAAAAAAAAARALSLSEATVPLPEKASLRPSV